jgi:hypothetical protein
MAMPIPIYSKDGSERERVRRCIQRLGARRVAEVLHVARATATGYGAGAEVLYLSEMMILAHLPDLEREAERGR